MNKQEQDVIRAHNERVAVENEKNRQTVDVPEVEPELSAVDIVANINKLAEQLEANHAALWMVLRRVNSGSKHVQFANGTRWATNDFLVPDETRVDLILDRALSSIKAGITDWSA